MIKAVRSRFFNQKLIFVKCPCGKPGSPRTWNQQFDYRCVCGQVNRYTTSRQS